MNESGVPLNSVVSPYRRLGRRVGLCRQECSTCDCSAQVAVALSQTPYSVEKLLALPQIYPEIERLILSFSQECGDIVSEPGVCEHVNRIRLPQLPLTTECSDEDL